jgi:co-chaperonin GroES (HSP10)
MSGAAAWANLLPLGERILVREIERTKEGRVFLAKTDSEDDGPITQHCEIVAAPEGCAIERLIRCGPLTGATEMQPLTPGMRVYIARFKSSKLTVDGEDLYVVAAEDVLVVETQINYDELESTYKTAIAEEKEPSE